MSEARSVPLQFLSACRRARAGYCLSRSPPRSAVEGYVDAHHVGAASRDMAIEKRAQYPLLWAGLEWLWRVTVIEEMARVAAECVKNPGRIAVWSERSGKYVCSKDPTYKQALAEQSLEIAAAHPPINPAFKMVFLTAAGGTLLFVAICVAVTLISGKDMPPAWEKLITGMFDLAKIGFGAVVGLLGGQTLRGRKAQDT